MALDEVLPREVAAGRRPPTLRIREWSAPPVIIGSFQSLRCYGSSCPGRVCPPVPPQGIRKLPA
jgi:hypothetical protein